MTDASNSKKASIPEWQRQGQPDTPIEPQPKPEEPSKEPAPPSRPALLEQASKFLQEDEIREASTDRKIAFLESKGLTNEEISKLIGVSRNADASSEPPQVPEAMAEQDVRLQVNNCGDIALTSYLQNSPSSQRSSSQLQQYQTQPRDVPPIITYPEFLLHSHSQKPPPLITARRLLYTLYLSGSLAASLYGLSKYILTPMITSLASARHQLAETAQADLDKLNSKLEGIVSEIPPAAHKPHQPHTNPSRSEEDSSEDEDPTELFHRDIGTQTSPRPLSHHTSSSSSTTSSHSSAPTSKDTSAILTSHTTRLKIIHSHLSEFVTDNTTLIESDETLKSHIADLQTYLDGLAYSSPSYVNSSAYGTYTGVGGSSGGTYTGEDEIASVKAEIRAVKGVLLSARNFPGSVGRVSGVRT